MSKVAVHPAGAAAPSLVQALRAAGVTLADGDAPVRIVLGGEMSPEEIREQVNFVLEGGATLLLASTGPLLTALHLRALDGVLNGVVEGLEPLSLEGVAPVTGVGYALFRVDGACIALDAPRGRGRVLFAGASAPDLVLACLAWISRKMGGGAR